MDFKLTNKCAFISAAGRGIGRSIAKCLAREGASLIVNSRTKEDLESLLGELKDFTKHKIFCADLTDSENIKKLIQFFQIHNMIPDIIVHNLGGNLSITDPLCSVEEWRRVQRINLEIPIEINRLIIPHMRKKKWGRICHTASIAGLENQGPPSYCAAKAALIAYTRSVGRFVAKDGIVMNTILPGAVFTEGGYWDKMSNNNPEHVEKYLNERMAIQRFGTPEEISEVVAFLCSDLASFCIGSAFLVDGGQGRAFYSQE
ncbi:hypothetical protein LCGC14_2789840 [marine sediment metagenome]|uniref:3-oxoacyl-[acyl-carrier-protein] reductase n=1 Tax=marine sediment metagenome TaxID=412755 RepID=A0A0F8ZCX1_9ZZZZ